MRHDIRLGVKVFMDNNVEPNFAALGRQYGADYRTIKMAYEESHKGVESTKKLSRPSLLDPYRKVIQSKLELNCYAKAIFKFIEKKVLKVNTPSSVTTVTRFEKNGFIKPRSG